MGNFWIIRVLAFFFSFLSNFAFVPILRVLTSVYYCDTKSNVLLYLNSMKCWGNKHIVLVCIASLSLYLYLSTIFLYYYIVCDFNKKSYTIWAKRTSECDIMLIIVKIALCGIDTIYSNEGYHLFVLIISFSLCLYTALSYHINKPYNNKTIMSLYIMISYSMSYCFFVLIISCLLEDDAFNGGIFLCIVGLIVIVFYSLVFYQKRGIDYELIMINPIMAKHQNDIITNAAIIERLCDEDQVRKSIVILRGYIKKCEEECHDKNCYLKQYLRTKNKILLYKHIERIFTIGILKFPMSVMLRLTYAEFAVSRLKQLTKAAKEIEKIKSYCEPSLSNEFVIYQIEREISVKKELDTIDSKENASTNLVSVAYANIKNTLKEKIIAIVNNYILFWNSLIATNQDIIKDLKKLSDIGNQIALLDDEIKMLYDSIQKINTHDKEINKLYAKYQKDILNKVTQVATNDHDSITSLFSESEDNVEIEISNMTQFLGKDSKVILVSGDKYNFGTITNCSLSICALFGFTKDELVGQKLNLLIPDIMYDLHMKILNQRVNKLKTSKIDNNEVGLSYKEVNTYGINKAKYLLPIKLRVALTFTELEQTLFICELAMNKEEFDSNLLNCFVLTNRYFIIQNYTANSEKMLSIHSNHLNGACDLTLGIKELNESYLRHVVDHNLLDHDNKSKIEYKRNLLLSQYSQGTKITWKNNKTFEESIVHSSKHKKIVQSPVNEFNWSSSGNLSLFKQSSTSNVNYIMTVKEITMMGQSIGFIFQFEEIKKKLQSSKNSILSRKISTKKIRVSKSSKNVLERKDEKIKNDFVPHTKNGLFYIDYSDLSYKMKNKSNISVNYKEKIKQAAMRKIEKLNQLHNKAHSESDSSDSSYFSESNSEEIEEEKDFNSSKEQKELLEINIENVPMKADYYKVDLTKVKLMLYDYEKNRVSEKENKKETQIDKVINDEIEKTKKILDTKKGIDRQKSLSNKANIFKKSSLVLNAINSATTTPLLEPEEIMMNSEILKKQITYLINRKDSHSSVLILKIATFLIVLCVIGEISVFSFFLFHSLTKGDSYLHLITSSNLFFREMIMAVYHVRELTLLYNVNYTTIYDSNRTNYINNQTEALFEIYQRMVNAQKTIQFFEEIVSKKTFHELNNKTVVNSVLFLHQYQSSITISLSTSISLIENAILKICQTSIQNLTPMNYDVYYFITNALNANFLICITESEMFTSDFSAHLNHNNKVSFIICIVSWVLNIFFLKVFRKLFKKVIAKRESYIQVFYDIDNITLLSSLQNCENFLLLMTSKKQFYLQSGDSSSSFLSNKSDEDNKSKQKSNYHKAHNKKQKKCLLRYLIWIFSLVFINIIITVIYFFQFISKVSYQGLIALLTKSSQLEIDSLLAYNICREHIFNSDSQYLYTPLENFTLSYLHGLYQLNAERKKIILQKINRINDEYYDIYYQLFHTNICDFSTDFFELYDNASNCTSYADNTIENGLDIVLTYYFEEIRNVYYRYVKLQDLKNEYNFEYNLTLMGTDKEKELWPQGARQQRLYMVAHPIGIFNKENNLQIHFLLRYIISPSFDKMRSYIEEIGEYLKESLLKIYISTYSLLLILIIFDYLLGWKIYETQIEEEIYKTKKMLAIIPIEALVKVKNISSLLGIYSGDEGNKLKRMNSIWK